MKPMSKATKILLHLLIERATGFTPVTDEIIQLFYQNDWLLAGLQKDFDEINSNARVNWNSARRYAKTNIKGSMIKWEYHPNIYVVSLIRYNNCSLVNESDDNDK